MPEMSAGRTQAFPGLPSTAAPPAFDPSKILWTVMYYDNGLRPYCPAYVGLSHDKTRGLLAQLHAQFPGYRFCLTETKADHLTLAQARTALKDLFTRSGREDLLPAARKARPADVKMLAPLAFAAARDKERLDEWQRINNQRKAKGLPPVRKPRPSAPDPLVAVENGRVVIHLGGAR